VLLIELAGPHVVQRSGVERRSVAGGEIDCDKHAHFQASRKVIDEPGYSNHRASIKNKIANELGLALEQNIIDVTNDTS
jgi:hypothetical protein